ncbi:type II toxin-antitoxin system VapC family toxin [Actinoalloteichus sp. GBA129-24]|uniref:type II toxin-antitoxin system VapC family toxin n=1 Tax=Actinoalloteichus sp. GBA129-24 TaxID=1612551 RepID=UPI0009507840|nr:type II toxin-antitoxin system VapC family toxin [Actinoalloteichus sp. GBA129-24]APU19478.1 putative nucleic acid-binding protein, contains PIN domain [Actinoalloteichus sp. GBA129-24]
MIYLDTAALVKLIHREQESADLTAWLSERQGDVLVSSALAEIEIPRALLRRAPQLLSSVPAVLGRIAVYEIDEVVRATAAAYSDPGLRSLAAIHLATAQAVFGDRLTAFVTYDRRLLGSATLAGLPIAHPGMAAPR